MELGITSFNQAHKIRALYRPSAASVSRIWDYKTAGFGRYKDALHAFSEECNYLNDPIRQPSKKTIRKQPWRNPDKIEALPEDVKLRAFPVKRVLSLRELKWLKENDPDTYKSVRATFKEAPGKAAIKIVPVQL